MLVLDIYCNKKNPVCLDLLNSNFAPIFWAIYVTRGFTLLNRKLFKVLFNVLILVLPLAQAFGTMKECIFSRSCSEVWRYYSQLLFLSMFSWMGVLTWSKTHQENWFMSWKMFPMFKFFSNCCFWIKCIGMFETNQFIKLNHDPSKSVEGKVQRL